jgi:hypothetical protein
LCPSTARALTCTRRPRRLAVDLAKGMEHRGLIWLMTARHGGPTDDPAVGRLAIHGVLEAMEPPELALLCETDR